MLTSSNLSDDLGNADTLVFSVNNGMFLCTSVFHPNINTVQLMSVD